MRASSMKMRAVIYYAGFVSKGGGAFMHVNSMRRALEAAGWSVEAVALDKIPFYARFLPHIVSHLINLFNSPMGFYYKDRMTGFLYKLFFDDPAELRVFEDVYISWNSDVPSITILHAAWSDNLQSKPVAKERAQKLIRAEVDVINSINHPVVTVSEPYLHYLRKNHFSAYNLRRIDVVPLGLDLSDFDHAENSGAPDRSMVYCGSMEPRKNVQLLLDVFRELYAQDVDYRLTIIGDGPDRGKLQRYCFERDLPVVFLGRRDHAGVLRELTHHKIYLHSSVKESFSFALLEAKLSGLKTFAYAGLEVPPDLIDVPVASFDPHEWCEAIKRACGQPVKAFDHSSYSSYAMTNSTLALAEAYIGSRP